MNEQLIVKNFGPIKGATVDFKKVTVFIGPTGGGKSTLAKLAAIFRDTNIRLEGRGENHIFTEFSLGNYLSDNTEIMFKHSIGKIEYNSEEKSIQSYYNNSDSEKIDFLLARADELNKQVKAAFDVIRPLPATSPERLKLLEDNDNRIKEATSVLEEYNKTVVPSLPQYVPAERIFISAIEYSWAGLIREDIGLPKTLLSFANTFSQSTKKINTLDIAFLNSQYIHIEGKSYIKIQSINKILRLSEAASGVQSTAPLLVTLAYLTQQKEQTHSFIIEEPELNLYPTAQQGLLNWLVEKCTVGENDLTITTHSPYILSHLNLLLYAYQVAEKHPDRADDVAQIVPRESWINPKEFACYQVENGGVESLVDDSLGLIDNNELDALSGDAADAFDNLIRLSKSVAVK